MHHWLRAVILVFTLVEAGWMAFDGTRALIVGTLVTPATGPSAGQLGPWRHLVEIVGLDPHGTPMKIVFAAYGWVWLGIGIAFAAGMAWSWPAMTIAAAGALWFLPVGTICSLIQIALLVGFRGRL
jgi:hypothetical protein